MDSKLHLFHSNRNSIKIFKFRLVQQGRSERLCLNTSQYAFAIKVPTRRNQKTKEAGPYRLPMQGYRVFAFRLARMRWSCVRLSTFSGIYEAYN